MLNQRRGHSNGGISSRELFLPEENVLPSSPKSHMHDTLFGLGTMPLLGRKGEAENRQTQPPTLSKDPFYLRGFDFFPTSSPKAKHLWEQEKKNTW